MESEDPDKSCVCHRTCACVGCTYRLSTTISAEERAELSNPDLCPDCAERCCTHPVPGVEVVSGGREGPGVVRPVSPPEQAWVGFDMGATPSWGAHWLYSQYIRENPAHDPCHAIIRGLTDAEIFKDDPYADAPPLTYADIERSSEPTFLRALQKSGFGFITLRPDPSVPPSAIQFRDPRTGEVMGGIVDVAPSKPVPEKKPEDK